MDWLRENFQFLLDLIAEGVELLKPTLLVPPEIVDATIGYLREPDPQFLLVLVQFRIAMYTMVSYFQWLSLFVNMSLFWQLIALALFVEGLMAVIRVYRLIKSLIPFA